MITFDSGVRTVHGTDDDAFESLLQSLTNRVPLLGVIRKAVCFLVPQHQRLDLRCFPFDVAHQEDKVAERRRYLFRLRAR